MNIRSWASISLGTVLCLDCAGTHREFGVSVSFVQSLTLDTLNEKHKEHLRQGGNDAFRQNVLAQLPADVVGATTTEQDDGSGDEPEYSYSANVDKMYHVRFCCCLEVQYMTVQARECLTERNSHSLYWFR